MGLARTAVVAGCLLLFLTADASGNKCTVGCHGMNGGKAYQEGHTYIYDLEGTSETSVPGAQDDAILKLKGTVELSVKPDCVRQIRLKGVQVNGAPISLSDVEQYPLQFNYHDGHIDTEICTDNSDSQASLNIKRGVVSLFQSAVFQESGSATHHEVDVFGGCPTDFNFHNDGDSLVVKKERNLLRCSHRENIRQGPVSAIYDPKSDIQAPPTVLSHQKIEQRFKRGVLNRAVSVETYKLTTFKNGDVGAKTVVQTSLTLKGEKGDNPTATVSRPRSLIFEAPHPVIKSSPDKIDAALKAASAEMAGGVKVDAAEKFAELIKVLRLSSKNDILAVYQQMKGGDKAHDKKMFLDALYRAGSGEAAEVVMELIKKHELTDEQLIAFYANLALVDHVNLPSVVAITNLLDQPNLPRLGYLGIGQVIGKYCQEHSCDDAPEVKQAILKIREKIGNGKAKTRDQENVIVSALKALGNTKFLDDASMEKLASIVEDKHVRNRVRVAAIEALPTRCSMSWKNILLKVLADREEDSEIRIKSYLSLVDCACPHVASGVKEILDKETVNQVGSFIQSHLRNLRASTDPNKAEAKRQLGLIKPRKKFPEDFRKFSFNNELSYNMGAIGLGSSVESNVIYSQNGFTPRSISLNVTTENFGRSFNLLDLNMRMENLDRLLEHYFGPKGRFTQDEFSDVVDKGIDDTVEIVDYIKQKFNKIRSKREVKQGELDKFAKGVKLRNNEVDQNVDLDLSIKMFGVEMGYMTYNGNTEQLTPNQIIDKLFDKVDAGVHMMKNFHHHIHNHLQFLDAELIYPTNMGMGLSLDMIGTSVVHMKTYGGINIPNIMNDPDNAEIHIGLEPSISVRIAASMAVKGLEAEAGMKVVGTLHTDTAADVYIKLLDGTGIDVNVKAPKKKEDLTVSTMVLLSSGQKDTYKPAKFGKNSVQYKDCFDQFSDIVTICGHVEFPQDSLEVAQKKALFPLNGPSKFSIHSENEATHYHMKIHYDNKSPKSRSFEILLETPNSKNTKRVSLIAEAGLEPDKYARISLDSPIRKASAEAILKNNDKEKSLTMTVLNERQKYYVRAGLSANGAKYKPILEYNVPEHIEKLTGAKLGAKASGGQQYNVDGEVEVVDQNGGKKYVFDKIALLSSGQKVVGLDGYVLSVPDTTALDMKLGYGDESVALKMEGKKLGEQHYSLGLSAIPTKDPNIGFDIKWECRRDQHEFEDKLIFIHGPDLKSKTNRLTVKQHIISKPNAGPDSVLGASSKISYPAMNVVLDLEGKITPNTIDGDIEISYEKFKFGTELSVKRNINKPGEYEVEFEAELMQNKIKLESECKIIDPHKSKYKNSIELSPGGKYEAEGVVMYIHDKSKTKFEMDGDLNLDGKKVKATAALDVEAMNTFSRASLTVGNDKCLDFLFKLQRGTNPEGSLTLNLKNYLNVDGQMSMQGDKGNAHLNIDLPKIKRKIKGTGDLTVAGTQNTANFELLLDAEKDPSKRIKLSTVTDIKKNTIDSKNSLEVLDNKFDINCKGKFEGYTGHEGELMLDTDITLPNGRYLVYKIKRTATKNKNDKYDLHVNMELADHVSKGGASRRITYVADANMVDFKTSTFQSNGNLKYVDMDGESGQLDLSIKNLAGHTDGHKKLFEIALGLSGKRPINMPHPFNLHYKISELNNGDISCDIASSLGKDFQFKSVGTFLPANYNDKGPCEVTGNIEMILPSKRLRNIKLDFKSSFFNPPGQDSAIDLQESATLVYNDDQTITYEGIYKLSGKKDPSHGQDGELKIVLGVLKSPRLVFHDTFKYTPDGDKMKVTGNTIVSCGDKEMVLTLDSLVFKRDMSYIHMNGKATTPFEKLHQVDFTLNHESGKGGRSRTTDVAVTADNEKYTLKSEIEDGIISPQIHLIFTCPKGKTELLSKFEELKTGEYTGEWKVETPQGFAVADAHVNLESIDNFVIDVNFDSDKIKYRKLKAEIANRATAKTGRRIVITILSDSKNIVTGSTSYKKRDEAGKITVEGSGHLKIGEETRSSSFKYSRQLLTRDKDGETGVVMVLNAKFDPVAIVGELKLSDKEIFVYNNYCEQSKDCAHFKLQSTYDTDNKNYLKHQLTVEVDLKKFNVPAEFGLKTNTECNEDKLDHSANLYLHSSKDKSEYTYHIYAHPKESAIILTLPSRELALIGTYDVPKTKQTGAFKAEVSLYLDRKNKPSEKTGLIAAGDANMDKNSMSLSGEVKFVYPSQKKDMMVKGRLHYGGEHLLDANMDIDIFAKKSQKINVLAKVSRQEIDKGCNFTSVIEMNSRGQQLKVDLKSHAAYTQHAIGFGSMLSYTDQHQKPKNVGVLFIADETEVLLLVNGLNKELIKVDAKMKLEKNLQKIDSEITIAGGKPIVTNFEANDWNSFKFVEYQDNPNTKLTVNGRIVLGQLAEIHADAFKDGAKKDLFHFLVHLDEGNFLKPDFGYNKDNMVHAIEAYRNGNIQMLKQLKDISIEVNNEIEVELKDLVEHLKKAQPNVEPLSEYYQNELTKLKNEFHADQTIKDVQAILNKYFGAIINAVLTTMKQVAVQMQVLQQQLREMIVHLEEMFKAVYPRLKESYDKILHACLNVLDTTSNLVMAYFKVVLSIINEHQEDLKELAVMVLDITQDIAKIIFNQIGQIRKGVDEFVELLMNQMRALPVYEIMKEKYEEVIKFQIPESILASIDEMSNIIIISMPTEQLQRFCDATYKYIMKHVKHEKVDDANEIKKIYALGIAAVRSIIDLVESSSNAEYLYTLLEAKLPGAFSMWAKLPVISTLKTSIFNLLRNNELPTPVDMYYAYRPTLLPTDIVPPFSKVGIVVDGGHFFTFDGNHFSMPGDCNYILVQDMQEGNFSVVANFNKGNLVSVTVTEPKESITLKNNGNILVNNKPADFPASTKNLHAFLIPTIPSAHIKSDYGVHVTCGYKTAMVCTVRVSGFYHGKLRGLLGDGNNEQYDDYMLPSGKITESETEFANAYKLKPDCPAVNAIDHKTQQRNQVCTDYFSGQKSTLKRCFNYVNPTYYRDACDNAASANPQAPCLLAAAYYSACYYKRVFEMSIPAACANCKVNGNTINAGDTFSVKTPKTQADIILVIEQATQNEKVFKELIPALITDLKEELKQHGITDVHIGLIGYGEHMKWPQHYTSGGNLNIESEVKSMKFEKADPIITLEEAQKGNNEKKMTYLEQRMDVELGTLKLTDVYEEVINYPYRPAAVKAIVTVIASPCQKSLFPLSLQHLRVLQGQKIYRDLGLMYYQIYHPADIQVSGKTQKNIVGYDHDSVYVLGDSKKKPLSGNTELRSNMVIPSPDVCAEFAIAAGGTAFNANNFLDAKPNQKRQFAQVTARRIAEDITSVEIEKDCMCEQTHGLTGHPHCKIVERREKEQLARHTKGGVKG